MRCCDTLEARSWSIPSEDPYEEAAQQLFEQPRDHVLVFVPEFEHPEDLVPDEDETPASLLPPGFLSPRIPPLLPIPLSTPSTSLRAGILEADTPPQNRPLLATPRPGCEVGESSTADARQPGPTMAYRKDRAAVRSEIKVLRSEILAYEQEGIQTREALTRSEAYCTALKVRVAVLETHVRRLETRRGQTSPPTNPNNMTPEVVQIMIGQALLRNSGGGDGSHSSHAENPKNIYIVRPCYYPDFMKCHPLNFKGTEGAVGLTRWIEKMESVFNISGTLGTDAYTMTWSVVKKKMTNKYYPLGEVKKLEI
nr:hypothetical protein [Tanacetum cinerariifolium]